MDIIESVVFELDKVLHDNPDGLSFNDLFKKCKGIETPNDLSRYLHYCIQLGKCYKDKQSKHYFKVYLPGEKPERSVNDPVVQEIKTLISKADVEYLISETSDDDGDYNDNDIEPKTFTTHRKMTEVKPIQPKSDDKLSLSIATGKQRKPRAKTISHVDSHSNLKYGNLHRSGTGIVAYCLYLFKNSCYLNRKQIEELTGIFPSFKTATQMYYQLLRGKYIVKVKINNVSHYAWSNTFHYPFSRKLDGDEKFVKISKDVYYQQHHDTLIKNSISAQSNIGMMSTGIKPTVSSEPVVSAKVIAGPGVKTDNSTLVKNDSSSLQFERKVIPAEMGTINVPVFLSENIDHLNKTNINDILARVYKIQFELDNIVALLRLVQHGR